MNLLKLNNGILHKFDTALGSVIFLADINMVTRDFTAADISLYGTTQSKERILQLACADRLASIYFQKNTKIQRKDDGSPFIHNNGVNLSISHTANYMAMIFSSTCQVAVDIEIVGRKIDRIKERFTTDDEYDSFPEIAKNEKLLHMWSIKECLFKLMPVSGVLFKRHLKICYGFGDSEHFESQCTIEHPQFNGEFMVVSRIFEDVILTFIENKSPRESI